MGGPDADTLISRNGGDTLNGGNGNNSYLPWGDRDNSNSFSNDTINSGTGLNVVYLRGTRGRTSGCTSSNCSIEALGNIKDEQY